MYFAKTITYTKMLLPTSRKKGVVKFPRNINKDVH